MAYVTSTGPQIDIGSYLGPGCRVEHNLGPGFGGVYSTDGVRFIVFRGLGLMGSQLFARLSLCSPGISYSH